MNIKERVAVKRKLRMLGIPVSPVASNAELAKLDKIGNQLTAYAGLKYLARTAINSSTKKGSDACLKEGLAYADSVDQR